MFVDTGGWFAYVVPDDPEHQTANDLLTADNGPFLTTDYVIDETLTLLVARGHKQRAVAFGLMAFSGVLAEIHYLTRAEIAAGWDVFQRYTDKEWSFTDCTSKVVIESLGIAQAFSFDHHFRQFGTVAVVP